MSDSQKVTLPNFIIIGAAKSGTSALFRYLRQHPDVYMSPVKEPYYFAFMGRQPDTRGPGDVVNDSVIHFADYVALFDGVTTETAIGEASPSYMYIPETAERIHDQLPDAKLIAILRQPAERAFSAYMHVVRDERETIMDFRKALAAEPQRIADNWGPIWHYKQTGYYYDQLARYYELFARDQIQVLLYDDFKRDSLSTVQSVFRFLAVDDTFEPDVSVKPNVSGLPKSNVVKQVQTSLFNRPNPIRWASRRVVPEHLRWRLTDTLRNRNLVRPALPADIRQELTQQFREDILRTQDLIDIDLSHWLV
jgi:hypothetical protein